MTTRLNAVPFAENLVAELKVKRVNGRWRLTQSGKIAKTKLGQPVDGGYENCKAGNMSKRRRERQLRHIEGEE